MSIVCVRHESWNWRVIVGPEKGAVGRVLFVTDDDLVIFLREGRNGEAGVRKTDLVRLGIPGQPDQAYPRVRRNPHEGDDGSGRLYLHMPGVHWAQARALETHAVLASKELITSQPRVGHLGSVILPLEGRGFIEIPNPDVWPIALAGHIGWRLAVELRADKDELATGQRVEAVRPSPFSGLGPGWVEIIIRDKPFQLPSYVPLALK